MPRYIDADTTIKAIRDKFNIYFEVPCDSDDRRVQEIIGKVKKIIQEQPTADVVEVVRCKDCIKRDTDDCWIAFYGEDGELFCDTLDNDYCGRGERRMIWHDIQM